MRVNTSASEYLNVCLEKICDRVDTVNEALGHSINLLLILIKVEIHLRSLGLVGCGVIDYRSRMCLPGRCQLFNG